MPINVNVTPMSTTSTKVECTIAAGGPLPPGVEVIDNAIFLLGGLANQLIFQSVAGPAGLMTWDARNPFTTNRGGCPKGTGSVNGNFAIAAVTPATLKVNVMPAPPGRSVFFYSLRLRDGGNTLRSFDPIIINT
jgi:hypothetical protein